MQAAHHRHGPYAKQQAGGDKGRGETAAPSLELALHIIPQGAQPAVQIQCRTHQGSQHDGQDGDQGVIPFQAAIQADIKHAQGHALHNGVGDLFRQPLFQQQPDEAPYNDGPCVDQRTQHMRSFLSKGATAPAHS